MRAKGDPEQARQLNIALILNLLKQQKTLSRAQLAKNLNLSKMTVSAIVSDLITEGIITEIGEGDVASNGGRKPILLHLSKQNMYVIGIDVGRTNIAVAIAGLSGDVLHKARTSTCADHSVESVLAQLKDIVESIITESKINRSKIIGIGFSIGGLIDKTRGFIDVSPDFEWSEIPMRARLEEMFHIPVVIDNCTRVMALGELWHGSATGVKNLFYVSVGFGIGSAIVMNNSIYENYSEFGHVYITRKNVRCDCGMTGCLEAVASGQAIEREANTNTDAFGNPSHWITGKEIHQSALDGNEAARTILCNAGRYLGRALSMVANLFHPEKIIIGGGVTNAGEFLYEPLKKEFLTHTMAALRDSIDLEISLLGDDAGMLGAVSLALDTYVFRSKLITG
jgi:glucokinase-like ROK family protein